MVDDEPSILQITTEMLETLGYTVITAGDGREALEAYRNHGRHIDLVILDLIMPHMSGAEVFEKLLERNPDIHVLLSSGYSLNGQAQSLLEKGSRGFIQKPYTLVELSRRVRMALLPL